MHPRKTPKGDEVDRLLKNAQEDAERLLRHAREDADRISQNQEQEEINPTNISIKKDKLYTIGEMSSRLAHDLQNPLTIIKNTIELLNLKNPNPDKKTKEGHDRIERAANKMSQQIHDVLDYVRTSNLVMEKTSILILLKDTVSGLNIPSHAKIILPDQNVDVYGDAKQLEIVFSNLILNALQARDDGGRVMIQASEIDDYTIIDVIDNGRGIEKEHLPRIFEPLFTTKPGGTGLGLASCKSIIENHGGTIECSSIVNKGTVFTIRLPKY
ncbi:MAG: HAMP domain-containing histidine kinase [Thaumarchaeota archaeon]|nr:HAMP domain-containing histidine kinase [Nitrososphaerota archaeon]